MLCADDLSTARQVCRDDAGSTRLSLVLVELQRIKGNGFSLAATLSRELKSPVYIISDRNEVADRHWCKSRGITGCLTRLQGQEAFLESIGRVLSSGAEKLTFDLRSTGDGDGDGDDDGVGCCGNEGGYDDSRRLPPTQGLALSVAGSQRRKHLLLVRNARIALADSSHAFTGLWQNPQIRSFVLGLLDPELATLLVSDPGDENAWLAVRSQCLFVLSNPVTAAHHPARQFRRGMRFVIARQAADAIREELRKRLQRMAGSRQEASRQQAGRYILEMVVSIQQLNPCQLDLRWMSDLPTMILYLAAVRHGLVACAEDDLKWFARKMALSQFEGVLEADGRISTSLGEACKYLDLDSGAGNHTWRKMQVCDGTSGSVATLNRALDDADQKVHEKSKTVDLQIATLSQALYQIMVCCQFANAENRSYWKLTEAILFHSLYQSSRNLIWYDNSERRIKYLQLLEILHQLRQGDEALVMKGVCLEVCLLRAVRLKTVQQRLSEGLNLLPRVDLIASSLLRNPESSVVLISDLRAELDRLTTDAGRLGVTWVGALAYALQQALAVQGKESLDPARRGCLVRGLYRLCRMLDQAAAWQPVSAAPGSINRLLQLRLPQQPAHIAEKAVCEYQHVIDNTDKYQQCLRLNQLIRMVLSEQKIPSGPASTLGRLMSEQSRLLRDAFSP